MAEPSENEISVRAAYEFTRNVKTLRKRYPNIRVDIEHTISSIRQGNFVGNRITQTGYVVFKARIKNRDIQKGKSAGYRLIYQIKPQNSVLLLTIYSKSDRGDISVSAIKKIITETDES